MMKKMWLLSALFLLSSASAVAQGIQQISVAVTSEAIGLPFTNYLPLHPGVEVTGTLKRKESEKNLQYFNVKFGGFHHTQLQTAFYLGGEYQYSHKVLKEQLSIDVPMGAGYLHSFYPGELYEQDNNGNFQRVNQFGRAHAYANIGIGATYIGSETIQPFVRQELMIESNFANGIPAIPHSFLKIGVTFNLK